MVKRLFDIVVSTLFLILLIPVFATAAIGIRLTSRGPVLYRAMRVGRYGRIFVMHKFRTMHVRPESGSVITAASDSRVFLFGRILRALKIDELPQLFDVLTGKMSIVGPRPEDPKIVNHFYGRMGNRTLDVAPGLASPGSIFNYTHGDDYLDPANPESTYVRRLLPVKLALELIYIQRMSLRYDLQIIARTLLTIIRIGLGQRRFPEPPEFHDAMELLKKEQSVIVRAEQKSAA